MDPSRVDSLAKLVGSGQSRRQILKTLAGGALASVGAAIGLGATDAAGRCRAQGVVCGKNADCCSTLCLPKDRTGRRVCAACASVKDCPAGDQCHTAVCAAGACSLTAKVNGTACTDGSLCTANDVCTNGVCAGTPIVCTALDQCHVAGTCDPSTGLCSNPAAADGTTCDDGDPETCNDVCTAGSCAGGACDPCETDSCSSADCPDYCDLCIGDPNYCANCQSSGEYCDFCESDPNFCTNCSNADEFCEFCAGDPNFCTNCPSSDLYCDFCLGDPNYCDVCPDGELCQL